MELRRLLRPGRRAVVLDFNRPDAASAEAAFHRFYLRHLVVPAARAVGLPEQYAYLEESLARFPTAGVQEELARVAGFSVARHRPLAGGLMGLLQLLA